MLSKGPVMHRRPNLPIQSDTRKHTRPTATVETAPRDMSMPSLKATSRTHFLQSHVLSAIRTSPNPIRLIPLHSLIYLRSGLPSDGDGGCLLVVYSSPGKVGNLLFTGLNVRCFSLTTSFSDLTRIPLGDLPNSTPKLNLFVVSTSLLKNLLPILTNFLLSLDSFGGETGLDDESSLPPFPTQLEILFPSAGILFPTQTGKGLVFGIRANFLACLTFSSFLHLSLSQARPNLWCNLIRSTLTVRPHNLHFVLFVLPLRITLRHFAPSPPTGARNPPNLLCDIYRTHLRTACSGGMSTCP